jgi:hypothetical protein
MSGPQMNIDLSQAEYMDFRVEEGDGKLRVKVADGSVIEISVHIGAIFRIGNDPIAGIPLYNVNMGPPTVRLVSFPPKLRKVGVKPAAGQGAPTGATDAR